MHLQIGKDGLLTVNVYGFALDDGPTAVDAVKVIPNVFIDTAIVNTASEIFA